MEVGKKYYIIAHAYWHYVGEVVEVLGPKTVAQECALCTQVPAHLD